MSPHNERDDDDEEANGGASNLIMAGAAGPFVDEAEEEDEEGRDRVGGERAMSKEEKKARKEEKRKWKSDEGRRLLRAEQRSLKEHIQASTTAEDLHKYRDMNNQIFKHVYNAREAVFDAENNLLLATKLVHNAERLVQVPSFDATKLVQKLRSRLRGGGPRRGGTEVDDEDDEVASGGGGGGVQWRDLGRSVGVCFNAVPERVSFLAGPLDAELPDKKRQQQAAERKKREPAARVAEVELKQVKDGDGSDDDDEDEDGKLDKGGDRLSAGEKNRKLLKRVLEKKHGELDEGSPGVPFLNLVLNPQSFTQSVENLFNFSSLLKKGEASIRVVDRPGLGQTRGAFAEFVTNQNDMVARQSVVGFDLRDWYRLCLAAGIDEGYLPHRPTKIRKVDAAGTAAAAAGGD